MFHFFEEDKDVVQLYHDCKSGKILCGEDKERLIEIVLNFVKEHRRKRRQNIDEARKILQVA